MISARSTACDSLLFVCGTLRAFVATAEGERRRRRSRLVGYARVAGCLYDLGRYQASPWRAEPATVRTQRRPTRLGGGARTEGRRL